MRTELINEYFYIYEVRNNLERFKSNYNRMSELWLSFSDEERNEVNRRLAIRVIP